MEEHGTEESPQLEIVSHLVSIFLTKLFQGIRSRSQERTLSEAAVAQLDDVDDYLNNRDDEKCGLEL